MTGTVDVRDMARVEARERVDRVKAAVESGRQDLVALWRGRAWIALGYETWDALCDVEFGVRMALPRDERREIVSGLRREGMSTRAIGSALGVDQKTVVRDLSTEADASDDLPDTVTGLDGRQRPAKVTTTTRTTEATKVEHVVDMDTGEVLDEPDAMKSAAAIVDAFAESGEAVRRARLRSDLMNWLRRALPFDVAPDEVASLLDDEFEWARIERQRADLLAYFDAILAARPRGLRIVGSSVAH